MAKFDGSIITVNDKITKNHPGHFSRHGLHFIFSGSLFRGAGLSDMDSTTVGPRAGLFDSLGTPRHLDSFTRRASNGHYVCIIPKGGSRTKIRNRNPGASLPALRQSANHDHPRHRERLSLRLLPLRARRYDPRRACGFQGAAHYRAGFPTRPVGEDPRSQGRSWDRPPEA